MREINEISDNICQRLELIEKRFYSNGNGHYRNKGRGNFPGNRRPTINNRNRNHNQNHNHFNNRNNRSNFHSRPHNSDNNHRNNHNNYFYNRKFPANQNYVPLNQNQNLIDIYHNPPNQHPVNQVPVNQFPVNQNFQNPSQDFSSYSNQPGL